MIPISLSISGFLSYRDPVKIDFTTFELACISGANGAGKSSILDAITWALFGQARKRDDSLINAQSDTAEVKFVFSYEHNIYRVIRINPREKSTLLEFNIARVKDAQLSDVDESAENWKTLSERTQRATQARIEETLRLNYDTFVNAAFFLQGKADQFTQQRPGDRKQILTNILGLEIWDVYRERAVDRRKSVQGEIAALDGRLTEINTELAEEDARKTRLAELETDLERLVKTRSNQETVLENIKQISARLNDQRKLVETLGNNLGDNQKRLDDLNERLANRQQQVETHSVILSRQAEIEKAYAIWVTARHELEHWDAIADQFREQEKRRQPLLTEIEAEKARLTQESGSLKERQVSITALQDSLTDLRVQETELDSSISNLESSLTQRKQLETELVEAQDALANAKAENPRLKTEMDDLKSRIDQLDETDGAACPLCGQPLSVDERTALVDELNILGKTLGDKYRVNRKILTESNESVTSLKSQVESMASLDDEFLHHKDLYNRVTAQIEQIEADSQTWEQNGLQRLEALTLILHDATFAPESRAKLAGIDEELKEIGYDAEAHDQIRQKARDGQSVEADHSSLERAKAAFEPLKDEIDNLASQINTLQSEVSTQQSEFDAAAAQLAATEAQAPDIHQAQRALLSVQEQENRLLLEVGAAQNRVLVLDDLRIRRKSFEAQRETLAQKVGQLKQIERAFSRDGVPALLIEQALPQIEAKANEILERLSGGSMSVRFITQREYKDKKRDDLRETLDIQISDNAGVRDYEMFSGGEAFRVNFAIRLALSEILAQRAGARLQTLVIDEGFGSQDEMGRQRLIEAINTVKPDFAKILVITHIESLKDAFPTRIEVTKSPRGSLVNVS